jgi:hypothetical protein
MDFHQLRRAVEIVARHADYPGKQDLIRESLADLDALHHQGRVTAGERLRLRAVLLAPPEPTRTHERELAAAAR